MFLVKIIAFLSAVLNIGQTPTKYSSSDRIVDTTCMTAMEEGQLYNRQKQIITIVGHSNNTFLIGNNKGIVSVVPRNQLSIQINAQNEHWKYTVNINKNTFEVCEQSNPINKENNNIPNAIQVTSDTDETIVKTNYEIHIPKVIKDANIKNIEENTEHYDKINNAINPIFPSSKKKLVDDEIENVDEFNINFVEKPLKEKSKIAEKQSNKIVPENNDKTSNLNEQINQINVAQSIHPKLENDFSAECSLDSCAKNTYLAEKEQRNESVPINRKSPNVEKTNDTVEKSKNQATQVPSKIALQNNNIYNIKEVNEIQRETTYHHPLKYDPEEINQQSSSNDMESQTLDVNNDLKETSSNFHAKSNSREKPAPQNPQGNNINSVESTKLNTDSVKNSLIHPSPILEIMNETGTDNLQLQYKTKIDFLWNIFDENSYTNSDAYPDQTVNNQKIVDHCKLVIQSELYFIVLAAVTLLFSLIYYKYQKEKYEKNLLSLLTAKDEELVIVKKQLLLKEERSRNVIEKNDDIEVLNEKLFKSENIIHSQAIRIEKLVQDIEELTESGMEMHKLLSCALESSSKNEDKLKALKVELVDSENLVAALTQKDFDKTAELERKTDILKNLEITANELNNKNTNLIEENAKISSHLEQVITEKKSKESKLLDEINSLKFELDKQTNTLITANNEVFLLKESMQEILSKKFNPEDAKKALFTVELSAEIKSVKQKCEEYKKKLDESLKSNQQHLDHIDVLISDKKNLENAFLKLEKKNEESINQLRILTKFFKEQEKQYLNQINEKVMLCENQKEESTDLQVRVNNLKQEITNYKSEIQSLRKEITDQEASFKIQISAADKKANDHWISFRQAERKLKEMELETAQLRNKITMVDKKLENGAKSLDSSKNVDKELDIPLPTVSPEFILLDFEPPPPILNNNSTWYHKSSFKPKRHNQSISIGSPPPKQKSSVFRPVPQRYNSMNRQYSFS